MKIKQCAQLKFSFGYFSPAKHPYITSVNSSIYYVYAFFMSGIGYVLRQGIMEYIQDMNETGDNFIYNMVTVSFDNKHNLVYLSDELRNYEKQINTPELNQLADDGKIVELCRRGIVDHAVLTQENFLHLVLTWEKINGQDTPYLLIYQDENDWYDSVGFDSLEAMEKFIADHTSDSQEDAQNQIIDNKTTKIITVIIILLLLLIRVMKLR